MQWLQLNKVFKLVSVIHLNLNDNKYKINDDKTLVNIEKSELVAFCVEQKLKYSRKLFRCTYIKQNKNKNTFKNYEILIFIPLFKRFLTFVYVDFFCYDYDFFRNGMTKIEFFASLLRHHLPSLCS